METNALHSGLAGTLSEIGDSGQGTLVSVVVRKKGVERGKASDRQVYGDDLVHVLVWAGFQYKALVERSERKLEDLMAKSPHFIQDIAQATLDAGHADMTIQDAAVAIQEIQEQFRRVLQDSGSKDSWDDRSDLPDPVWEPLKVNGVPVKGVKVYVGAARPDDPRSPQPGAIYLDGVKLGEKVLEKSSPWTNRKKPKSAAKDVIRAMLPIGLYTRYQISPEALPDLKVGKEAGDAAKTAGIVIDPDRIRMLFKIA
jgi:hypothetical protein